MNMSFDFNGESFLFIPSHYIRMSSQQFTWWNPFHLCFFFSGRRAYLTYQVNHGESSHFTLLFAVLPRHDEAGEQLSFCAMSKRHVEDQWQQNGPKFHFILWVSW